MTLRAFAGGCALAAGTVACVCSVQAADLPVAPRPAPAAPVVYAPPPYNWSGFYVGGNIGGGFADSSWSDPFTAATDTFSKNGFIGGGQIGANAQFNWLVVGVEGDFDWTGLKGSGRRLAGQFDQHRNRMDIDRDRPHRRRVRPPPLLRQGRRCLRARYQQFGRYCRRHREHRPDRVGWTAGAGLEYGIDRNWSAKIEYDYLGFGSEALNLPTPTFPAYTSNASLNVQEIKAGLNFRFGGGD